MSQKPVETLIDNFPSVNDKEAQCVTMATDGPSSSPSKRKGWIASLFGSTSSNSSQETEETDGAKKQEQSHKEEHITVPSKGNCASFVTFRSCGLQFADLSFYVNHLYDD